MKQAIPLCDKLFYCSSLLSKLLKTISLVQLFVANNWFEITFRLGRTRFTPTQRATGAMQIYQNWALVIEFNSQSVPNDQYAYSIPRCMQPKINITSAEQLHRAMLPLPFTDLATISLPEYIATHSPKIDYLAPFRTRH